MTFLVVYAVVMCGVFGAIIGSFLNVVAYRLPAGLSVVRPPSACPACEHPIRARDNIPVIGWLVLRGKCRDCAEPISARYPIVEAGTGVLFALVALRFGLSWELPAYFYLAALAVVLSLIDLDTMTLPQELTMSAWIVAPVTLALPVLFGGQPVGSLTRAAVGGLGLFGFYLATYHGSRVLLGKPGMGKGDVKLAGPLGAFGAFLGWAEFSVGTMSSFLFGAVIGVGMTMFGNAGRKTPVPFGPFMLGGCLFGVFAGPLVARAYLGLFGL